MTIKELIEQLQKYNQEISVVVVISEDPEPYESLCLDYQHGDDFICIVVE
jgi:hypothetical protein